MNETMAAGNVYLIAYNINEQVFDYTHLKGAIMSYGDVQHPMESIWFVCVSETVSACDIHKKLKPYLQCKHDHIFVSQIANGVPHSGCMQKTMWRWLKSRLNNELSDVSQNG